MLMYTKRSYEVRLSTLEAVAMGWKGWNHSELMDAVAASIEKQDIRYLAKVTNFDNRIGEIALTIEVTIFEEEIPIDVRSITEVPCPECHGTGFNTWTGHKTEYESCKMCGGKGMVAC